MLDRGRSGEIYNIAGNSHKTNLDMCRFLLDALGKPHDLIEHVADRPGHDRRYAPDGQKIARELGWTPQRSFDEAMPATIRWYEQNAEWLDHVRSGAYRRYYEEQYGKTLA